jgi:outer membrane protein TolC
MKRFVFSFFIFIFCLFIAAPAGALNLEESYRLVLSRSPDLKELQLRSEAARWEERKVMADFLPRLEMEGRHLFDERFEELEVPFNGEVFVMPAIQPYSSLGFSARWEIFKGFETRHRLRAAEAVSTAYQHRLRREEEAKRTQVRTLFYRALGSQILADVAEQNIRTLEGHLNDVKVRVRSGVSTQFDTLRVEVQLDDARTEKTAADGQVVVTRAQLFEALAFPDDGKALVGQMPEDFNVDLTRARLDDPQRDERAALLADKAAAESRRKAANSHWYPEVSLFGNYEWYNNLNHALTQDDERFKSAYAVGLQFSWNLFDGGAALASQKQALLADQIAANEVAKLDLRAPVALEEAKRRFTYDVSNYKAKLSSIKKAAEAVRLAKGGLRAGTRTNTEVLDAVVDLNRAKAAAVKSQIDAIEALGELELSVGHSL